MKHPKTKSKPATSASLNARAAVRVHPMVRRLTAALREAQKTIRLAHVIALRESKRLAFQPHMNPNSTDWIRYAETLRASLAKQRALMRSPNS